MANLFVTLPTPAANGSGAAVDASGMDANKTITVVYGANVRRPIVTIEISNDVGGVNWAPLVSFTGQGDRVVSCACRWMRATVTNFFDGPAPVVGVGALGNASLFVNPIAPAASGAGAAIDISMLPAFKTIQVATAFLGVLNVQISEDGGATFTTVASFTAPGQLSGVFTGDHLLLRRDGVPVVNPGLPLVNIAASSGGGGGGGGSGNAQRFTYVATGAEGDTFTLNLPAARANANYIAQVTGGGLAGQLLFDTPRTQYTVNSFQVKASAPLVAGDVLNISVEDLA